ncbi:hypothetical protein PAXRUDRAFT_344589 [Paxillus rubicundulus Ve08.2h10]|uniref:Uncharacterized protein n=1 Tax=Paxillus rubicundulus Ve08.2h10 TaxID=930991 RepID=A0A0D0DEM7_9AGAM|nr:hypothetical protein PAXRUDRAFT_344589 [Paxillus rubicundulus Ve08.2h10]
MSGWAPSNDIFASVHNLSTPPGPITFGSSSSAKLSNKTCAHKRVYSSLAEVFDWLVARVCLTSSNPSLCAGSLETQHKKHERRMRGGGQVILEPRHRS